MNVENGPLLRPLGPNDISLLSKSFYGRNLIAAIRLSSDECRIKRVNCSSV